MKKQTFAGLVITAFLTAGLSTATSCKKEETEETGETVEAEPTPPPEPEPTVDESAKSGVASYPNMVPQGGQYRVLRNFQVFRAAEATASNRIGGIGAGTIIYLKATMGAWLLVEYPSGPGTMSPGWIQLSLSDVTAAKPVTRKTAKATGTTTKTTSKKKFISKDRLPVFIKKKNK